MMDDPKPTNGEESTTLTITTQDLWDHPTAQQIIQATEQLPFLQQLMDGSLPLHKFQYYIIQDIYYLKEFSWCLRYLSNKVRQEMNVSDNSTSSNNEVVSQQLLTLSNDLEMAEITMHNTFCKEWDIHRMEQLSSSSSSLPLHEQMPYTLLYTSYMKQIVTTGSHLEGLVALLPCFWVYAHIGNKIVAMTSPSDDPDHPSEQQQHNRPSIYETWIQMYSGDDFNASVQLYRTIIDDAMKSARNDSSIDFAKTTLLLQQHFNMACQMEYMFWDQPMTSMNWPINTSS